MSQSELAIVGLNIVVCVIGCWVCLGRMGYMSRRFTKLSVRIQYATWFSMFVASGISWTYDEPASVIQFAMTSAVLGNLLIGLGAWRYGPPDYTLREAGCD